MPHAAAEPDVMNNVATEASVIRTPDYRLRIFISSSLKELTQEREAVRQAVLRLRLVPVMFESGARPHAAQSLYQAYLAQSHIFVGIYWQTYGWVAPNMPVSGLEEEFHLSAGKPRLIYIKEPAPERHAALSALLDQIRSESSSSYQRFTDSQELADLVSNDLALLLTERFESMRGEPEAGEAESRLSGNLPIPRNLFVGRGRELDLIRRLMRRQETALVTLAGPGGVGKSRLALHAALSLRAEFPDGIYLVPLETIDDSELVVPAIARTLQTSEPLGTVPQPEALPEKLRDKRILLLLDNFEHLLSAGPQIAELLERCPRLKVLVTSRAPLHLRAERVLPVPPLAFPSGGSSPSIQSGPQYPAIQLFVDRARAVRPDFEVTSDNAVAVYEICKRLDGLPLAIELAAARIKMLSPYALLDRLGKRFEILRDGTRDLPPRQRTLRGAIEWSYRLLGPDQQRLLRALSVFAHRWTFEAASAVGCGAEEQRTRLFDDLEALIDNNLLKAPREIDGELRLGMLETIREFGREQLHEAGEADEVHCRHIRYYVEYASEAQAGLMGSAQETWHKRIAADLEDIRQAVNWALQSSDYVSAAQLLIGFGKYLDHHGYWRTALDWAERLVAGGSALPAGVRATLMAQAGWMTSRLGDFEHAVRLLDESIAQWRDLCDPLGLARALDLRGVLAMYQADYVLASKLVEESVSLQRTAGDDGFLYDSLTNLALVATNLGQDANAAQLFLEALERARDAGDSAAMALILGNLGEVYSRSDAHELAEASLNEAEAILMRLGDRVRSALVTSHRGVMALRQGDLARAAELQSTAIRTWQELDQKDYLLMAIERMAMIACARDTPEPAVRLLAASSELRRTLRFPPWPVDQRDSEACLSRLRAATDPSHFDTAWMAGKQLPFNEAVAAALGLST